MQIAGQEISDTSIKRGRYWVELCQCEGVCSLERDSFNEVELYLLHNLFLCWKRVRDITILRISVADYLM